MLGHGAEEGAGAGADLAGDPAEPEDPGGLAVAVPAGQVPVAAPAFQGPGLDAALLGGGGAGLAVLEGDRAAVAGGGEQRFERGLAGGDARFEDGSALGLGEGDAGGAQLLEGAAGGAGHLGLLPDAGGEGERGGFLGVEGDLRQAVAVGAGEVAEFAVEGVLVDVDDQSEFAQVVLVPLEHPVEGFLAAVLPGFAVGLDGFPQLLLGERTSGVHQAQGEIHQPLCLGDRHR